MLKLINVTKKYGNHVALSGMNYEFDNGIYGLLGANGAGKSTLMNLITDNIGRTGGEILYDGKDIIKLGAKYRELVGYMPQVQGYYEYMSARNFLFYLAELKGIKKKAARIQIDELLDMVNLSDVADKKMGSMSGGMKQRVLLAQALLGNPKVILLDEPTAGLDPKERVSFRQYIDNLSEDRIIIISTHVVSDVESIADRILIMKSGQLVEEGTPEELMSKENAGNLEEVFVAVND